MLFLSADRMKLQVPTGNVLVLVVLAGFYRKKV